MTGAPIEFAHIRSAANAGTGLKPHDAFGISLCRDHHAEQHRIGQAEFERKYSIELGAIAAEFVRKSPDKAMRESLNLVEPEYRCVKGHDLCNQMYPGPNCPYCELAVPSNGFRR